MTDAKHLEIRRAVCRALFVFDVGREVDLAACRRLVHEMVQPAQPAAGQAGPASLRIQAPPLRLDVPVDPPVLEGRSPEPVADVGIYDFGAVALTLTIPAGPALADLCDLSCALSGNAALSAWARSVVQRLLDRIAPAITGIALADVSEDHLLFEVTDYGGDVALADSPRVLGPEFAKILRSERHTLSAQEVRHATATRVTRTPEDLVLLDWNAALVFHREPAAVRAVLELANVQLLEMRFLDRRLDESLQRTDEIVAQRVFWRPVFLPDSLRDAARRIAGRQVEAALLYERVNNALKLVGDQYLARVYRRAARRFGLAAWSEATQHKLAALESIYGKVHDRSTAVRAEMLEWIIIGLIAFEIVLSLLSR